jgi:flap endonuclease-1
MPAWAYKDIIAKMEASGFNCFVTQSEADFALNFLSENGHVDWVMSDDADLLVSGCKKVVRDLPRALRAEGPAKVYDADTIREKLQLSKVQLQELSCLVGCDYCEGLKGVGGVTAIRTLKKFSTLEQFVTSWTEEETKRYKFQTLSNSGQFLEAVDRCKELYNWRPDKDKLLEFLQHVKAHPLRQPTKFKKRKRPHVT